MISISPALTEKIPDVSIGILAVRQVMNCPDHPALHEAREELVIDLRNRYSELDRKAIRALPVMAAYDAFYRNFRKTYHVQLQLESIVFKGKPIFSPSALVGAMFMAELKTGLLTAAHDLAVLDLPLSAEIAVGKESYKRLDGTHQELKAGDLYIRDEKGILSSVIYGPDQRTRIQPDTNQAVYTTYGPPGISKKQVLEELEILEGYLRLFAPQLTRDVLMVL